ncbi:Replication factor-A carboxy-terminal domain protein [Arachis hypogaea]|uniref:Replication factor-A carboxy-terminal domain protein n=1 Tax=Arachis hypogaea TaxID=3818 RepID=A0A6B9V721_ARAHY|nr:Replication factor-A carboxy-terminal domain protein [Arachis hypogaea]
MQSMKFTPEIESTTPETEEGESQPRLKESEGESCHWREREGESCHWRESPLKMRMRKENHRRRVRVRVRVRVREVEKKNVISASACTVVDFAPMISCLYAIEWRCIWTEILFSLHFHPQFEFKKMHPPREAWRLKVRVLRLWVVPSFGNHEVLNSMEMILLDEHCEKIQATIKKPFLNRFRDHIVEGQVYRMAYFTVVSNHGSYRATSHEFKLVFLHQTTVVAVDEDVIPKTYFNMFSFSELLNMTQDYDFLVDYVNQVNHFLASGYVEQPVVVIQLAKVKFFRGQVGLQNVIMIEQGVNGTQPLFIANEGKVVSLENDFMRLTRKCTIEELQDNNEEGSFIIFGTIRGIVEDGGWWYSACVCGKGIYPQNGAYYCDFCLNHITNVTPRFKIKITLEDHSGEGIFLLFDREASYLLKKSCADLFTKVQRDASLICGDTYPPIFQGLIGKKLLLKVDTKGATHDTFYGTFRVRRICDDPNIIAMFELLDYDADDESTPKKEPDLDKFVPCGKGDIGIKKESSKTFIKSDKVTGTEFAALINGEDVKDEKTPSNDTVSDDLSAELDILLSSPEKETQEVLSHVLDAPSQYGEKLIHENHVVTSNGKRNLNPQFEEAAADVDGRGFKIAKVNGV